MKYAVIYQSKNGNTRLIAEQIYFWIKSRIMEFKRKADLKEEEMEQFDCKKV